MSETVDPRGLIKEAFKMEGLGPAECRTIFLDWALSRPEGDERAQIETLLATYGVEGHAMMEVLGEGLTRIAAPPKRRGGSRGRRADDA